MNPLVTVNILSYNRKDELRNTLQKVYEQSYKNIEVIVVDNASTDGSPQMVKKEFPGVILIELDKNIGIAGWNKGFEIAKGEYVLVLDDDSYPEFNAISLCVSVFSDQRIGLVATEVYNTAKDKIENEQQESGYVNNFIGCGAIIRKGVVQEIGGFNELLFLYSHEVEFSMRLQNANYKIYFYREAKVIHTYSPQNRVVKINNVDYRVVYYGIRNRLIILMLYFPFKRIFFRIIRIILGHLYHAPNIYYKIGVIKGLISVIGVSHFIFSNREVLSNEVQAKYGYGNFAGGFFF